MIEKDSFIRYLLECKTGEATNEDLIFQKMAGVVNLVLGMVNVEVILLT